MMRTPNRMAILTLAVLILGALATWQTISSNKQLHKSVPLVPLVLDDTTVTPAPNITQKKLNCPKPTFSKKKLPITALASFPGSGNTWTRHLIQAMTGTLTGAVYRDKTLRLHGFPGEGTTDGSVIVIKTHSRESSKFTRCVLLMRNPYGAFLAESNRRFSHHHTGSAKLDNFSKQWNSFFMQYLRNYSNFHLSWIKHNNLHLVMYDNLVEDLEGELTRLLKFLQNSTGVVGNQNSTGVVGNVQCALTDPTGAHKRDHSKSVPIEFFYSNDKIILVNTMIDQLYAMIFKRFNKQVDVMKTWKLPLTKGE